MSRVLCTDPMPQYFADMCQALLPEGVQFVVPHSLDDAEFADLAADAEILFVIHRPVDARLLALAPKLRFIQRNGIGYESATHHVR